MTKGLLQRRVMAGGDGYIQIQCPFCKKPITIWTNSPPDDAADQPNTEIDIGLDGTLTPSYIVCTNERSDGEYCRFAADVKLIL